MARERNTSLDAQKSVTVKLSEPVVDSDNPWADDLLARRDIATQLTNLVSSQEPPLTISLHGQWGTGKTFMLRRWQKTLELDRYQAIYFNAWDDDFCDNPLLAMIGQLSEHFMDNRFKELARKAAAIAIPLIKENFLGVLKSTTGLTIKLDNQQQGNKTPLDAYLEQRATKDSFKNQLGQLSEKVATETGHPLVFIVDELDRCRPTFAIELLERVKHIFDVPHIVFVFGLNRDELSKSLASVYGDINTDVYLRRFFDFEFTISEFNSQRFAEHLIDKFQLVNAFRSLSEAIGRQDHIYDYDNFRQVVPRLWSALGLSLRDIDYGIRLLALVARNVSLGTFTHPFLLAVLIAMKFKRPENYRSLVTGNFHTSEIMDYIDEELRRDLIDDDLSRYLDRIEGFLYCADRENREGLLKGQDAMDELDRITGDVSSLSYFVISQRAQNADQQQVQRIIRAIVDGRQLDISGRVFGDLAALIDTYQLQLRS